MTRHATNEANEHPSTSPRRIVAWLVAGALLVAFVAFIAFVARPTRGVAVADRFSQEGMLAEAGRFLDDPAFRREALERSLVNHANTYSKDRLAHYALEKTGWDLLPEWNPRSLAAADVADVGALRASAPIWDGKRPRTHAEWVALGEQVFFRYPMRADVIASYALAHPGEAATHGIQKGPDGTFLGLVRFVDVDGVAREGFTCALCHANVDGGKVVPGEARRTFDFGALRLAQAATSKGTIEPELARRMRLWGPGRADVTEDDDEDPVAIPDLFSLRAQTYLTQAGTIRHEGISSLAIRQETQLLTSNHQKIRPPRTLAVALAFYVYALDERRDPPRDHPGKPLFEAHCARCHSNAVRGGDLVSAVSVGTDSALAMGKARGTGYLRTPALLRVKRGAPYLHHGAVRTLADLLSPERLSPGFHGGAAGDGPVPGHPFGTELSPADRAALVSYVEAM